MYFKNKLTMSILPSNIVLFLDKLHCYKKWLRILNTHLYPSKCVALRKGQKEDHNCNFRKLPLQGAKNSNFVVILAEFPRPILWDMKYIYLLGNASGVVERSSICLTLF